MANLKVEVTGLGDIDNAAIYLDDPTEKLPHFLQRISTTDWLLDNISLPMADGDELLYSLYVAAFTGTKFTCVITNKDSNGTITFSDITGKTIRNKAISTGQKKFQ